MSSGGSFVIIEGEYVWISKGNERSRSRCVDHLEAFQDSIFNIQPRQKLESSQYCFFPMGAIHFHLITPPIVLRNPPGFIEAGFAPSLALSIK